MSENMLSLEFENLPVRSIVNESGETLWVAKDICDILGYTNSSKALSDHCNGVTISYPIPDSLGREQHTRVIGESDVFKLISRCTLPAAEKFNRWLFGEVLPSIRKTGGYSLQAAPVLAPAYSSHYLEQSVELLQQSSEIHFNDLRSFREELDRFYDSLPQKMENIYKAVSGELVMDIKGAGLLIECAVQRIEALERLMSRFEKRMDRLEDRTAS